MKKQLIGFHTHIFTEDIASRAINFLTENSGGLEPITDGTLKGLLLGMNGGL